MLRIFWSGSLRGEVTWRTSAWVWREEVRLWKGLCLKEGGRYLLHGVAAYISSCGIMFKENLMLDSERFQMTV